MAIKKHTTFDIMKYGHSICPDINRDEYFKVNWVKVDDILAELEKAISDGNVDCEVTPTSTARGFSSAIFLSWLKHELGDK